MCVPILRSIGTKLKKLENMQISRFIWFIWRHVTQKRYVMRHGDSTLLIGIVTRNILKQTRSLYDFRFKSYGSNSGFRVFGDLDLWPMFYCLSHALRIMYWNIHAKFHWNPSSNTRWYALDTHTHTHTHTPKVILIVSRNARLNIRCVVQFRFTVQWNVRENQSSTPKCHPDDMYVVIWWSYFS